MALTPSLCVSRHQSPKKEGVTVDPTVNDGGDSEGVKSLETLILVYIYAMRS